MPTLTTVVALVTSIPLNFPIPQMRMLPISSFTVVDNAGTGSLLYLLLPLAFCKVNSEQIKLISVIIIGYFSSHNYILYIESVDSICRDGPRTLPYMQYIINKSKYLRASNLVKI